MRFLISTLALAFTVALARPAPVQAQLDILSFGAYGAHVTEAFGGSTGIGGFVGADIPVLPITARAAAERYFPDCGHTVEGDELDGCKTWAYSLDVNVHIPLVLVRPYLSGGIVYRYLDPNDLVKGSDDTNVALGGGIDVGLLGVRAFGEARYEFTELPEEQWVIRIGLFF